MMYGDERNRVDLGLGPEGFCFCPKCEYSMKHVPGKPCQEERCPKCDTRMIRAGSDHHELWLRKRPSP